MRALSFPPSHASHPLDPFVRLSPGAHPLLSGPSRTLQHFTDHVSSPEITSNCPFQYCSRSVVPHAPSLTVCLSRTVFSQSSQHFAHQPPATRTPHHHLDPDDIAAASASSCSLQLRPTPMKLQSPHNPQVCETRTSCLSLLVLAGDVLQAVSFRTTSSSWSTSMLPTCKS